MEIKTNMRSLIFPHLLKGGVYVQLELYNAIWLFAVFFMLHDFEELITVENWSKRTESRLKERDSWIN
ncbi:hypothetical protein BFG57_11075 [Bacillus solimangrovi]|uniref:HXXEE domain-containing protein n=1 Tax=Bacillus solimangrovi TaxID=1305675 RepID=A0A1E5LIE0_9BACI|nr:hypothetical protein BFG57_11075 [Bacillus solimangrovi]